jgi:hypothetical protein
MTVHPREPKDLMLAPVAVQVDLNLQRLRGRTADQIEYELGLELDRDGRYRDRAGRAELVRRQATRNVELHGWTTAITDDCCRLHLEGGSVSLDLGLSAGITAYILNGAAETLKGAQAT